MNENFSIPHFVQDLLEATNKGYTEIAKRAEEVLKLPVIISNPLYHSLGSSIDEFIEGQIEIDFKHTFIPSYDCEFFTCNWIISDSSLEAIGHPIKTGNELLGYFFLITEHEQLKRIEDNHEIINYICSLISFQLQKNNQILQERLHFKEAFLFNLLYGNLKRKSEITSYASIWHWNLDEPHLVVSYSIRDFELYSEDSFLINILANVLENAFILHGIEPILLKKQLEVISIIPVSDKYGFTDKKILNQFIQYTINQTKRTKLEDRAVCGVGKSYEQPTDLFRSYQEAKVSLELGVLLKNEISHFENLGMERILYRHDLQDLKEYFFRVLGPLINYDKENGGELFSTLESFAANQFDLKQTSEALFLHRNTLRYRIKKIEEILEIELDDMENRLDIVAALKIKRLHRFT